MVKLSHNIGLVFQYPEHQLFEETVAKDVAFGPKNLGLSEEEIATRVRQSIEMVGLHTMPLRSSHPRVIGDKCVGFAIAGYWAMEPQVLIWNEPTAGLDPRGRTKILSQIKKLHQTRVSPSSSYHTAEDVAV